MAEVSSTADSATETSASAATGTWSSMTGSGASATWVTVGAADWGSAVGGAATGGFGGMTMAAGGRATDCGVMKRGAGLGGSATATDDALAAGLEGLATVLGGCTDTADTGATVCRAGATGVTGRADAAGWAAFCVIAFNTSPGLEMCDKSILGLNSSACATRELRVVPGSPCSWQYFFTRSASSGSIELECVFFSVTPTLPRMSRTTLLFTSSSRARSLIRIFCCIPPCFLRIVLSGYACIASSP